MAQKDDALGFFQEAHGGQTEDLTLVNGGQEAEVKVLKGLAHGNAGHSDLVLVGEVALACVEAVAQVDVMNNQGGEPFDRATERLDSWWVLPDIILLFYLKYYIIFDCVNYRLVV